MVARHLGVSFGTTSVVHAWHRTGAFLLAAARRLCLAPSGRYVDDFFGVSKAGVELHGGDCLDVLGQLVGFPCKPEKSVTQVAELVLLGAHVAVCLATQSISVHIDEKKVDRWSAALAEIVKTERCERAAAEKMAGRLNFAVSVSMGKVGRAYIGSFYA